MQAQRNAAGTAVVVNENEGTYTAFNLIKRERGRYSVFILVPKEAGQMISSDIGEVKRNDRIWRHLLAPEREFSRMRDCARDLVYQFQHPEHETAPYL